MNINFTEKEYRLLLDVVFLADWMQSTRDDRRILEDDEYQMLFQKVYSYAKDMGCAELVKEVVESNRYTPTARHEETTVVFDWVEDYEEAMFWQQLLERLVERDVYAELPGGAGDGLSESEFQRRAAPYERKYAEELNRHGLDRLAVVEN